MGKRGPKPQPATLKLLRGNPGKRPLNDAEPAPPPGDPIMPDWLNDVGRAVWERTLPILRDMGVVTVADADQLALYCEAWEDFHAAREIIAKEGVIAVSEKGGEYQHPAVGIKNKAAQRIRQIAATFGLNPSARSTLKVERQEKPKIMSRKRA